MKTCEEITKDIDQDAFSSLSFKERLAIKVHLLICKPCLEYKEDGDAINVLLARKFKDKTTYSFTDAEKESLRKLIGA